MANGFKINVAKGCDQESNDTSQIEEAVAEAHMSEIGFAFVELENCNKALGRNGPRCEAENEDRPDLALPGVQHEPLEASFLTGEPVVVVVSGGGALTLHNEARRSAAMLCTWYNEHFQGQAIADMLFGVVSPSGRLPTTLLTNITQVPENFAMSLRVGVQRTYRHLSQESSFDFGFGFSFSEFESSEASAHPDGKFALPCPTLRVGEVTR